MARLLTSLLSIFIAVFVATGSLAHAAEPAGAFTVSAATVLFVSADHAPGDSDQVPADADKSYPHHHGSCHGHHEVVPIGKAALPAVSATSVGLFLYENPSASSRPSGPNFRPPRA